MVETVQVKPALLTWAIERSRVDSDEIFGAFPRLPLWLSQKAFPTRRQLESFARKTLTPFGYFYLPTPPAEPLPLPDFRTKGNEHLRRPSPNLLDTLYTLQARQAWMSEYLKESGHAPVRFGPLTANLDDPFKTAVAMRNAIGLTDGWAQKLPSWESAVDSLRDAVQTVGIFIVVNSVVGNNVYRKLDPEEFRGFVLADEFAPMVFLNGADAKSAQMFTLAHELAHLWVKQSGIFDLPRLRTNNSAIERFCNRVAAEFLVPAGELREVWSAARRQREPFKYLARHFKVSPTVAALRAADLNLVERGIFDAIFDESQKAERQKFGRSGGGDFYNTQNVRVGKRFARLVMEAAKSGRLLFKDAYRLTGLHGETFDRYARRLGVTF